MTLSKQLFFWFLVCLLVLLLGLGSRLNYNHKPTPTLRNSTQDYQDQINYWVKVLEKEPDYVFAHIELSRLYLTTGQIEKAKAQIELGLALYPNQEELLVLSKMVND